MQDMERAPGGGYSRFMYTDAYGMKREAYGMLLAVNSAKSNREGIIMCVDDTETREKMCLVRENDDGVAAFVRWVDRIPGKDEGWYSVWQPVRTVQDEGWSSVLFWVVLAGIVVCVLYGTGNL